MAVKHRHTHGRTARRRGGQMKAKKATIVKCSKCGSNTVAHHMCNNCGHYDGKKIVDVTAKLEKKQKKLKEKELKEAEKDQPLDAKNLSKK
jgi:large subunit ribosomal protein L32